MSRYVLSIGIVGLPNVGKSTLFNALTSQSVTAANYPFATIDPNVGVISVPDERLDKLHEFSGSGKKVPAVVEFYDIAGIVKGANKGEGLGNQFLTHIRNTQAIVVVLRTFHNNEIIHVEGSADPLRDLETIQMELILKDLETVEKRWKKIESEAKTGEKEAVRVLGAVQSLKDDLEAGKSAYVHRGEKVIDEMQLLTAKRQLFLLNGKESDVNDELLARIKELGAEHMIIDLAQPDDAVNALIEKAYSMLGLMSFFTTGEDESRAWTIKRGSLAPEAAGAIHTDFERLFIRAEVVSIDELFEAGSWNGAKQKGKIRIEGKEYEVKNGDVMVVRHG